MSFVGWQLSNSSLTQREKGVAVLILLSLTALTLFDIWEDIESGMPLIHYVIEGSIALLTFVGAILLFKHFIGARQEIVKVADQEVQRASEESSLWREKLQSVKSGLLSAITKQLQEWGLTPAEQEVAFLLISGYSLSEIAQHRSTSERTVRQQASTIYKKSNLEGRAQLSAFFLEDLLTPISTKS